jgi:hypothetical protein
MKVHPALLIAGCALCLVRFAVAVAQDDPWYEQTYWGVLLLVGAWFVWTRVEQSQEKGR